ncbi:type 1 glutamine amidotransferase domain-containing protein [Thalassotalea euphylliae]|uniref:type 1 glutamine amidotransferase domain-containing protein n=1 Tax=Thalassotalea euphylliae TaxID=1655234 RepID=UPI003639C2F9
MKKLLSTIALISALTGVTNTANANEQAPNILMVLSSYGEKSDDGEVIKPGFEFDEMSKSYLVFDQAGANVTFASPKGGKLIADKYDPQKRYNQAFLKDEEAVKALDTTIRLKDIDANLYDAVYVVGGKGPMYDLANDVDVKRIIAAIYEDDGVVGAVCHGPAALLDVQLSDGQYLIADKRVSGFTNQEETAFTKKWKLPFSLEDKIKAQGAHYQRDGLMLNQVSIDDRIVTAQNPFSTADAAKALVQELGLSVDGIEDFKDDRTVKLAEMYFADRQLAAKEFANNTEQYDTVLLAMLGVYQSKFANTQVELDVAIAIMEQTQSAVNHPMLDTSIAKAYTNKNQTAKAVNVLQKSQKKFPDNEAIASMLAELSE